MRKTIILLMATTLLLGCFVSAQDGAPLRGIKTVQVDPTVVSDPQKVKDQAAPNLVQDALRNALRAANIELADSSPIHFHLILDEFTSGSQAKRTLIGLGAGRSTVTCRLVMADASGKELANIRIHVRGNLAFSPYEGDNTQRRQALSSFDQRLMEEIERMK